MSKPRQPAAPAERHLPTDRESEELDEALEESFPASDPIAVSITTIDPSPKGEDA
jgi:hypothetical protein